MEQKDLRPGTEGTGNLPVVLALPLGTRTTCVHVRAYLSFISMRLDLVGLGGKWEKKGNMITLGEGMNPKRSWGPLRDHVPLTLFCSVPVRYFSPSFDKCTLTVLPVGGTVLGVT